MSAYVVVNAKIADMEKYRANLPKAAQALHDRLGAKMLARTDQPVMIAGKHNGGRMVLLEFANTAKAQDMAWSVDRLGGSLQGLIAFLFELHALKVDLFLKSQELTPRRRAARRCSR